MAEKRAWTRWSIRGLRRWVADASNEEFQPDGDLLTPIATGVGGRWMVSVILFVPMLVGVIFTQNLVLHLCFAFGVLCLLPNLALVMMRRQYGPNPSITLAICTVIAVSCPNLVLATAMSRELAPLADALSTWPKWSIGALGMLPPFLICAALVFRYRVLNEIRAQLDYERARAIAADGARATSEAHLKALQAQIEPHFLYNTLANVQQLVRADPAKADDMLQGLIGYLRTAMPSLREASSTLGQEFALSAAYLEIMRLRYEGRLTVRVVLPPELASIDFPPLIVQTLVENAIKHGVEPKAGSVEVVLTAHADSAWAEIAVTDSGRGLDADSPMGTGLRNTRERLAVIYGGEASLTLAPNTPTGVRASVRFPRAPRAARS